MMRVTTGSLLLCVTLRCAAYTPPIGCPDPGWGIESPTVAEIGAGTFDYGAGAVPLRVTSGGIPYIYYIDKNVTGATDSLNTYGTEAVPRVTPVQKPALGSLGGIMIIAPGGSAYTTDQALYMSPEGTPTKPFIVRGLSASERPEIGTPGGAVGQFGGSYTVYEHLYFRNGNNFRSDQAGAGYTPREIDHHAIRHCVFQGSGAETGAGAAIGGIGGYYSNQDDPVTQFIVIYANTCFNYGLVDPETETDWGGFFVNGHNCRDIWFLNNTIYHTSSDAFGPASIDTNIPYTAHRIYTGLNTAYDHQENCYDSKGCEGSVISQNNFSDTQGSAGDGAGSNIGWHYGCGNGWVIFNEIYNSKTAISGSDGIDWYIIGNTFRDCEDGIKFWSTRNLVMIGNTFDNCTNSCISDIGAGNYIRHIENNIFSNMVNTTTGYHFQVTAGASVSNMRNNLFYQSGGQFRGYWNATTYTSLASFQSATSKGQDCLTGDPLYVNAATGNFRLQAGSPAIGAALTPTTWTDHFNARFPENLIDQGFEGTGYENALRGEVWAETGAGTIDQDAATSTLYDSDSLRFVATAQQPQSSTTFAANGILEGHVMVQFDAHPAATTTFYRLEDGSGNLLFRLREDSTGHLVVEHGTATATSTNAMTAATAYHVFWKWAKGTGADGVAGASFTIIDANYRVNRPRDYISSGNAFAGVTTGTATTDASKVLLGLDASGTASYYVDGIRIDKPHVWDLARDIVGTARGAAWDIGAFEFVTGGTLNATTTTTTNLNVNPP